MRRIAWLVAVGILSLTGFASCSEDSPSRPPRWPDGYIPPDGYVRVDLGAPKDAGALPDGLPNDPGGPVIEVLSPKEGAWVTSTTLTVQARVTDSDAVDDQSVAVTIQGGKATRMSATATSNVYEAKLDVSTLTGSSRLWVIAADMLGKQNSKVVNFKRDGGPVIQFVSPTKDQREKSSLTVQTVITDQYQITNFGVYIGQTKVAMTQVGTGTTKQIWKGKVEFSKFDPPLTGQNVLTARATNIHNAQATAEISFYVDDQGPTIKITSHSGGELIGGIIEIKASVTDDAGVLDSTVTAIVGNGYDTQKVAMKLVSGTASTYAGNFNTRNLEQTYLWPVISVRAADKLGNESHQDIQVGLDNGQPKLELDPPANLYLGKVQTKQWYCSKPYDPVGEDAINDLWRVPQISKVRVRIEDQGNYVPSAPWIPISEVDETTTYLYVLDDTKKALVVDTDGDGYCDSINPDVIPSGSKPQLGEAVSVQLTSITATGAADFRPPLLWDTPDGGSAADTGGTSFTAPPACDGGWGTATSAPEELCLSTSATVVHKYTQSGAPAIFTIPPVVSSAKGYSCMGLPFDFLANQFNTGWACLAAVAKDDMGNMGVSPPIRVYVDYTKGFVAPSATLPGGVSKSSAPHCTGTVTKQGTVDSNAPCIFNNPRAGSTASKPVCKTNVQDPRPQMYCNNEVYLLY